VRLATTQPSEALVSVEGAGGLLRLALVVVVCAGLAAVINRWGHLGHGRADLLAALRATFQLLVVGLLIAAVLGSWWLTVGFITLMLSVASWTAGRRLTGGSTRGGSRPIPRSAWWLAAAPVVASAGPVAGGLMLSGLIPRVTIAVVPIVGILIGGAMTATTLAGSRALDAQRTRQGEYEAALSIGLLPRDSVLLIARDDAALALVPGLDQTRTVGLVTLPGAFVGMLLGGASPLQAAAVQLVVLVALLLVQAIAVLVTVELVARGRFSAGTRDRTSK
jgi:putative ABC transport system permease protein